MQSDMQHCKPSLEVLKGVRQQAWRVLGLDLPIGTAPIPVSDPTTQSLPGGGVGFSPK
jgi:hypothetical protein